MSDPTPQTAPQIALVTGAGSPDGIGFATARLLAAQGFCVAITATTARIHERLAELGLGHAAFTADLTDSSAANALVAKVQDALGPITILVNNAGMVQTGHRDRLSRIEATRDDDWQRQLALNLTTAFTLTRAVLPGLQAAGYGRIVNVASVTGPLVTIERTAGYSAAKAAMCGLTRTTALENARHGITCNAVLPGWIATASASPREITAGKRSPAGRPGTPTEVAAACAFLASPAASYINGAMLVVDGANALVEMK